MCQPELFHVHCFALLDQYVLKLVIALVDKNISVQRVERWEVKIAGKNVAK